MRLGFRHKTEFLFYESFLIVEIVHKMEIISHKM